jgi:hypothetical protein
MVVHIYKEFYGNLYMTGRSQLLVCIYWKHYGNIFKTDRSQLLSSASLSYNMIDGNLKV